MKLLLLLLNHHHNHYQLHLVLNDHTHFDHTPSSLILQHLYLFFKDYKDNLQNVFKMIKRIQFHTSFQQHNNNIKKGKRERGDNN